MGSHTLGTHTSEMASHETVDVRCPMDQSAARHVCCNQHGALPVLVTLLPATGQRIATLPATDFLLRDTPTIPIGVPNGKSSDVRARAPSYTTTPLRHALLGSFLI